MHNEMNWFGVAGAISIFLLIAVSVFVPWWRITVGSVNAPLADFGSSPMNMNVNFLGQAFTFPLVIAINLSVVLSLVAGAITILIYSINPTKPYAKRLLSFSYKKPLYAVIIFVIGLIAVVLLTKFAAGLDVPIIGAVNAQTNGAVFQSLLGGLSIKNVLLTAGFQWPFYLAIASAVLCVAARLYNKRLVSSAVTGTPIPMPPPPQTAASSQN
jgi:hypothetical protein